MRIEADWESKNMLQLGWRESKNRSQHASEGRPLSISPFSTPLYTCDPEIDGTPNFFHNRFGLQNVSEWERTIVSSIANQNIQNIIMPGFPNENLQAQMHGSTGTLSSVEGAFRFYRFVTSHYDLATKDWRKGFLDFGTGWGRIVRPFMRDFALRNMYGYEPNLYFCSVARACNPYVNFISGSLLPANSLPENKFDLIVSWSVFSHLSEKSARAWLSELTKSLRSGGTLIFTTWGERFLRDLVNSKRTLESGGDVQWYQRQVIKDAGDIEERLQEFKRGNYVWFTGGSSDLYGDTFLSSDVVLRIISEEGLDLRMVNYDTTVLLQDAFVLIKS